MKPENIPSPESTLAFVSDLLELAFDPENLEPYRLENSRIKGLEFTILSEAVQDSATNRKLADAIYETLDRALVAPNPLTNIEWQVLKISYGLIPLMSQVVVQNMIRKYRKPLRLKPHKYGTREGERIDDAVREMAMGKIREYGYEPLRTILGELQVFHQI